MTREEAIRCLSVHSSTNGSGLCTDKQHYEAKQMAIKALEQEPCEDCISRQAVIEAIKNYASMLWEKYHEPFPKSTIMEIIQALPPVTPQQKIDYREIQG